LNLQYLIIPWTEFFNFCCHLLKFFNRLVFIKGNVCILSVRVYW